MWFLVVILFFIVIPFLVILTILGSKKVKEELEMEMNNPKNPLKEK